MTPRPPRTLARALGIAVVALAAIVVLALALQPWWLAPLVAHRLAASSGRAVEIDAMWLTVSSVLEPVVELRGVRIENAPWADTRRPLAALASATAVLSWRSIGQRRPVIALMVLRDGEVDLERRRDGLRNWRLRDPEERGPGHFKVLAIRGEHATLRMLHEPIELDIEAHAVPNADADTPAGDEPMPTRIDARGTWRGVPFVVEATTSAALTLLETGRSFRLRGRAEAAGSRLELDGHAGDIIRWPLVDARIALAAPSLARTVALLGSHGSDAAKALRVEGMLRGDAGGYALSTARGRLGTTDLAGDLRWSRGEQRDVLRAALTSESAELADLRSLVGRRPATAARTAAKASDSATVHAAAAASDPAATRPPHPLDIELRYAARRLAGAELPPLHNATLEASLAGGRLQVPRFAVAIGEGRVAGKANVEVAAKPMQSDVEVDLSGLRIESLLGERAAKHRLSGALQGRATLKTSGDSLDAMLASVAGTASAFVSGGTISSLLDAKMGLQGGRVVRSMLAGAEPIAIRCAAAVVDLRKGEGRIRTLVVDTERTRTVGSGSIDLAHRTFDVVLTPEAKQPGLFVLDRSIRLSGALHEPRRELVDRTPLGGGEARGCRPERP